MRWSPAKARSTVMVSRPLPATDTVSNGPLGASVLDTFLRNKETAVDASDTDTDTDSQSDSADEKRFEVHQAAQVRPRPQPPSRSAENPSRTTAAPTASTTNGTTNARSSAETEEKEKEKDKTAACGADADGYDTGGARGRDKFKMGLFSKKKKDADQNPYAEQPFTNPMTPYQQARNNIAQGQPAVAGLPSGPRMASNSPAPSYQTQPSSPAPSYQSQPGTTNGFGNDQYGNQGGYGADRYGSNSASPAPRAGGGYGGFDDNTGKGDLFGGAAGRYVPGQQNSTNRAPPAPSAGGNSNPALFGNAQDRYNPVPQSKPQPAAAAAADDEFGGYGAPRELTAEEQEARDVQAIRDQANGFRDESVASSGRTLALLESSLAIGLGTYARLGEQGERLNQTERKLDEAAIHSKDSAEKTKELKKLNGSMFVPVAGNPFTRKKREAQKDAAVLARHQEEKAIRSETLHDGYNANQMVEAKFQDLAQPRQKLLGTNTTNNRMLFEEDDGPEAREKEEQINENLVRIQAALVKVNGVVKAEGEALDRHNVQVKRITEKTDAVDDRVRMNREKLSRIR